MDAKVDQKQLGMIHMAVKQLGMDDDARRDFMQKVFGVRSAGDLTYAQASRLISHYRSLGFEITPRGGNACKAMCEPRQRREKLPENVVLMASPGQLAKISQLVSDIKWDYVDGYQRWLKKYFKIARVRYSSEASAVIEALKSFWRSKNCMCVKAKRRRV